MIGKLTGTIGGTTPEGAVVLEVAGVGYLVRVSLPTLSALQATFGDRASLFIHTAVREDAIDLYGFTTDAELSFFKQLIGVSGVGPKTALGVLNVSDLQTLKRSIGQGDASILTKVFGIGKKSAERIVVELRDKLAAETVGEVGFSGGDGDVIEALMGLGYRAEEARQAVKQIGLKPEGADMGERVAAALKLLGTHQ